MAVKMAAVGGDAVGAAIGRCASHLQVSCDRLISMGWSRPMAETFLAELFEKIVHELIKVKPVPTVCEMCGHEQRS
jgi:hypothetical protein